MLSLVISFILTLLATIIPLIYIIDQGSIITEELIPQCIFDKASSYQIKICVSCFDPIKTQIINSKTISTNYLQYQRISVVSKTPQIQNYNYQKKGQLNKKTYVPHTPFRPFTYKLGPDHEEVGCREIRKLLEPQIKNPQINLNELSFEKVKWGIDNVNKIIKILFVNNKLNNGKYHIKLNRGTEHQLGFVFKQSAKTENFSTITIQYFSYETFIGMELFQILIGAACLIFLIVIAIKKLARKRSIIDLIVNLAVLLGAMVPELLKIVNVLYLYPEQNIEILHAGLITNFKFAFFICLCFKRVAMNKFMVAALLGILMFDSQILAQLVIFFVLVVFYIGYTSLNIEYKNYTIYVGTLLLCLTFGKIQSQIWNDDRGGMICNILVMMGTVCIQTLNRIRVQQFQQVGQKSKSDEMGVEDNEEKSLSETS